MESILEVNNIKVHFPVKQGIFSRTQGYVYAVDGVSFTLNKGETLGLVGESGCGKTTTGMAILQLVEKTSGQVIFHGKDISDPSTMSAVELIEFRKKMQIVFQDPFSSLNPRMTVEHIIGDPMRIHKLRGEEEIKKRVVYLMEKVGLSPDQAERYPHEFSGGQRQRIGIARALSMDPDVIIADEPVSALDVSIQAQVINLLVELQQEFNLSYIFIAHDLAVVEHICDRIAVMYLGKIVEIASYKELFLTPKHPYTKALFSAIPIPDPRAKKDRIILEGDVPNPINPPSGCSFNPRCPACFEGCDRDEPVLRDMGNDHFVACNLYNDQILTPQDLVTVLDQNHQSAGVGEQR